jgi:hypothetical protein
MTEIVETAVPSPAISALHVAGDLLDCARRQPQWAGMLCDMLCDHAAKLIDQARDDLLGIVLEKPARKPRKQRKPRRGRGGFKTRPYKRGAAAARGKRAAADGGGRSRQPALRPSDPPEPVTCARLGITIDFDRGEIICGEGMESRTAILAGMPLRVVAAAAASEGMVDRDTLIDKVWGRPRPSSADAMLTQQASVANARLRTIGLELHTERGVGIELRKVPPPASDH